MIPPNFALFSTCLFVVNMARMTTLKQPLHFQSAHVGGSVTLTCSCFSEVDVLFFWFKQTVGQTPKLVSKFYIHGNNDTFHNEFKDQPRFSLDTGNRKNHLKVSDLRVSDSATYYCVRSNLYNFFFCKGTVVEVKGSGVSVPALVHQSASETVQPGGSVTLNCTVHTGTCDGEHSVYWFRQEGQSHPGLIYTQGGGRDQCERTPGAQTHTCVYNLPMESLNLSHAGTYYCAVASCGHILFGNETKLDIGDDKLVYFLSAALMFTTILVVLLALLVCAMYKRSHQCSESHVTSSAASTPNTVLCEDAENLHYATLRDYKATRSRRQRHEGRNDCVYSSVGPDGLLDLASA